MVNEAFMLLSEEEKHSKLRSALQRKTAGCLSDSELEKIVLSVPLKRQYAICVYRDADAFRELLTLPQDVQCQNVLGLNAAGTLCSTDHVAAVITKERADPDGIRQIHIFIPPERSSKGMQCV